MFGGDSLRSLVETFDSGSLLDNTFSTLDLVLSDRNRARSSKTKLVILFDGTTNQYSARNGTKFRGDYEDRNKATNIARILVLLNDHRDELLAELPDATTDQSRSPADRNLARTRAWQQHLQNCFRTLDDDKDGTSLSDVLACSSPESNTCVFYFSGVGTVDNYPKTILQKVRAKLGALNDAIDQDRADAVMKDKVERARRLLKNYKQHFPSHPHGLPDEAPELYVFGFSRGAAEARLFVHDVQRPVEFLGLFDTVPGNASVLKDEMTIPREVKKCVHIMSLDERRFEFGPLPIAFGKDGNNSTELVEFWHRGDHSDVGGGHYLEQGGISFLTLQHMLVQCPTLFVEDQTYYAAVLRAALGLDMLDAGETVPDFEGIARVNTKVHGPRWNYPLSRLFGLHRYNQLDQYPNARQNPYLLLNHPQQQQSSPLPALKTNIEHFIFQELSKLLEKNDSFGKKKE